MSSFSQTPVVANTIKPQQRIAAFDLARGLAIFLMIVIHVLDFYGTPEVRQNGLGAYIKTLVGWPAASVFVFIMGVFLTYSSKLDLISGLKRAAALFALGYLLNFARSSLPMWLSVELGLITYQDTAPHTPLSELLIVDILQFAGLAFAICLLLKHYLPSPKYWLLAAIAVAFSAPLFWSIQTHSPLLDEVLKLLWGNQNQGAMFPQFPWLSYPLVGMAFGHWLKETNQPDLVFTRAMWAGAGTLISGIALILTNVDFHMADNLRGGPGLIVAITGFTLMVLSLCHYLVKVLPQGAILNTLYFWSKHVTVVYVVQWLLVGWGLMLFGLQQMDGKKVALLMVCAVLLSHVLTKTWLKLQRVRVGCCCCCIKVANTEVKTR